MHQSATELAMYLIEKDTTQQYMKDGGERETHDATISAPSSKDRIEKPLFLAAKLGIVELVEKILQKFPQAIESVDSNGKNLLHLAAEYRQERLFHWLTSNNFPITNMVERVDVEENTPLHLAVNLGDHQPRNAKGAPFQMSWEIFWYKRVRRISTANVIPLKNTKGETADELFRRTHKELVDDAKKWARSTTNIFMVISTLIATINVTAAFSLPGGYNGNGLPTLLHNSDFSIFVAYIAMALFNCVISLGFSLSAHLSHFTQEDFYICFPIKFLLAATAFFYSVIFTVTTFVQAIIIDHGDRIPLGLFSIGVLAITIACTLSSLIYVDILYPFYKYLIDVGYHLLTR